MAVTDGGGDDGGRPAGTMGGLSLTDIPLAILRAELERRGYVGSRGDDGIADENTPDGSTCGSGVRTGSYNTPLHVAALVLILVLSTFACSFPIIARRFPRLPIPRHFLFLSRHFGTGVLIATAFVHLLPTAFISLTNPCLPRFWNKGYPATAGLVAMIAVMIVVTIEMFFAIRGAKHVHGSEYDTLIEERAPYHETGSIPLVNGDSRGGVRLGKLRGSSHPREDSPSNANTGSPSSQDAALEEESNAPMLPKTPGSEPQDGDDEDLDLEELDPFPDTSSYDDSRAHRYPHHNRNHDHDHDSPSQAISAQAAQKQLLQCLLLEAGILFHSVFIGMALSVATGTSFLVLLVAISFHQTFEGFALGSRIASLIPALFPASSPKPWLMALAYGATTPLGQAIGLGLHNLYDPASTTGLLMVGMTNAFSSGLLLFAGLVELLAEDFLSDRSYETLRGKRRIEACIAAAAGAALMALVGAFA
ncbi:hypothetical protein EMCG_08855 [[Emmonsia] crescens]|uniref:Solute carrier family 39 (Zinc transporter), member 1/2/3 n=1 Tax=[Emmonsia] crescens TaxID=73230 RepID=A0A0G2J3V7_9EURO|nr:hypothetical protein EMCG_08855 [Emmonsia crescens UAMH 3008]